MARSGRFGRLPRTAPDLSGAIASMMREYEAQRERNIVDAWKNGGKFEGKKATDAMLLSFFDHKLDGLSKDDPLYTEAENTASQYRFAVRNSKQELAYARGKVSDGGMAAFYRREASAHPADSEIYRQLMKLAAQYHDRAGSGGGGGGGGGSSRGSKAERDARIETPKGSELAWKTVTGYLLDLARRRGIVNSGESNETATPTTGEGFGDLQVWQGDFASMKDLVNEFATSPEFAQDRAALTAYIQRYGDPKFDGNFTLQGVLAMRGTARAGLLARLADAQKNGTKTQIKAITKELTITTKAGSALSVIDPMTTYEEAHETWQKIVEDPKATPLEKWDATQEYREQVGEVWKELDGMAAAAAGSDGGWSSAHAGRALTEWKALGGDASNIGPTLWEETRGHVVGLGGSKESSDAYTTAQEIMNIQKQMEQLLDGSGEFVLAKVDASGKPTTGEDYEIGVVSKGALTASGIPIAYTSGGVTAVDAYGPDGKKTQLDASMVLEAVYGKPLIAKPVGGLGVDGKPTRDNFEPIPGTQPTLGAVFDYPDGTRVWQVTDTSGVKRFTTVSPFAEGIGATLSLDNKGNMVVSWVADPGQSVTKFNPASVIDTIYSNPELANQQTHTVFKSSYVAHLAAKINQDERTKIDDPKTMQAALLAESGGDGNVYVALLSEAQAYGVQHAKNIAAEAAYMQRQQGRGINIQEGIDASRAARDAELNKPISESEFNARALDLLQASGSTLAIPGYNELKRTPGADLAKYVRENIDQSAADLRAGAEALTTMTKGTPSYDASGRFTITPPVAPPRPPEITGFKDDGRPIFGNVTQVTPTGFTVPKPAAPSAPPPPKPVDVGKAAGAAAAAALKALKAPPPPPKPSQQSYKQKGGNVAL